MGVSTEDRFGDMGSRTAPEMPQNVGARTRTMFGWIQRGQPKADRLLSEPPADAEADAPPALDPAPGGESLTLDDESQREMAVSRPQFRIGRPSQLGAAILAVALAVAFVGGLTYYGARKFTRDAADTRASEEANSLASQSTFSATGDAFNGYLQMLRYAEDPVVRSIIATAQQRRDAMQQLLYLNTNKLAALAIVSRDGLILATTEATIADMRSSEAFTRTRANLSPTNSDIILPEGGGDGYVEFTAPLKLPDGEVWAILYGRAVPDVLWAPTLRSSVDGSRNVILNSEGLFSAGVPQELVRQPWRGVPLDNGSVRANIAGVDSICGLGPIGRDTQIDHGWHVASCLPVSLMQLEADRAMGQQVLVTTAGAVLAIVIAGGLLWFALNNGAPAPASVSKEETPYDLDLELEEAAPMEVPTDNEDETFAESVCELEEAAPTMQPASLVTADVDALHLIEAYEGRAARFSAQLRETVQARLLIAATQADQAYKLRDDDPARSEELHKQAMSEFEAVRDHELRSISQELHPALIRLGLPGALRALAKELGDAPTLSLDIDPLSDSAGGGAGRVAIDAPRRLIVFRALRDAVGALKHAGAAACELSLKRDGDWLRLRLQAEINDGEEIDEGALAAGAIGFAAYGGQIACSQDGASMTITAELPAPGIETPVDPLLSAEVELDLAVAAGSGSSPEEGIEAADEATTAPVVVFAAPLQGPEESLGGALRELVDEMAGKIEVALDSAAAYDEPGAIDAELAGALRMLVGVAIKALVTAGSPKCAVSLQQLGIDTYMSVMSDTGGDGFDGAALAAASEAIEARGGHLSINRRDGDLAITAEIPGVAPVAEDVPMVVRLQLADDVPTVIQVRLAQADDAVDGGETEQPPDVGVGAGGEGMGEPSTEDAA